MPTTHAPLYVQIQDFIRDGVRAQRFKAGERLPSESEIARRFSTTRATVARALQELTYEGLIRRRAGSGTYVGGGEQGYVDAVAMNEVQGQEDRLAAAGEPLTYQMLRWEPGQAEEAAATALGFAPGADVWELERLRQSGGAPIAIEHRVIPAETARLMQRDWLETLSIQEVLTRCIGIRIGRIENRIRAATAGPRLAKALDVARSDALLVREHVIYDALGRPILWGHTRYRGDFSIMYTQRAPGR